MTGLCPTLSLLRKSFCRARRLDVPLVGAKRRVGSQSRPASLALRAIHLPAPYSVAFFTAMSWKKKHLQKFGNCLFMPIIIMVVYLNPKAALVFVKIKWGRCIKQDELTVQMDVH